MLRINLEESKVSGRITPPPRSDGSVPLVVIVSLPSVPGLPCPLRGSTRGRVTA